MATTPASVFLQWLGSRARDCRVAVAVDGDPLQLLTDFLHFLGRGTVLIGAEFLHPGAFGFSRRDWS